MMSQQTWKVVINALKYGILTSPSHCIKQYFQHLMKIGSTVTFLKKQLRKVGQRANGRRKNKPGERLVCRMRTGKCVSFHLLSKIKQHSPLSLKRGFLIRNLHLFFPAAELLVLFHTLFFLPCLRKHST